MHVGSVSAGGLASRGPASRQVAVVSGSAGPGRSLKTPERAPKQIFNEKGVRVPHQTITCSGVPVTIQRRSACSFSAALGAGGDCCCCCVCRYVCVYVCVCRGMRAESEGVVRRGEFWGLGAGR
jgi:hypothetical protein